jgi:hypothetical protein
VESILDRAQKLFGRGFLIAAFVPTVFFVLSSSILYWGFTSLAQHAREIAKTGWKENVLELGLWLLMIYLLAYVLYGTRTFVHQLYQGGWRITLSFKILSPLEWILNRPYRLGIWLTTHRLERYKEIAEKKVAALDWPNWVLECDFGDTFSPKRISESKANTELPSLRRTHQVIVSCLDKHHAPNHRAYCDLLARAHILRANLGRFSAELRAEVEEFITTLRTAFHNAEYHGPLELAVTRFEGAAERDWSDAQSSFVTNFPDDARWIRATQLGTVAAVNDRYPHKRYGITLNNLWPRLIQVVPEDARARLEDANIYLDFTLIMSVLSGLLVTISVCFATWQKPHHLAHPWNVLVPVACFVSFFVFYRLSIEATRTFGAQVQAAVDLFRLKLLDALDVERPSTPTEEKQIWKEIHFFIEQADLPTAHVRLKAPSAESVPPDPSWWASLRKALTRKSDDPKA